MRPSQTTFVACFWLAVCAPVAANECNSDGNLNQAELNACYGKRFSDADANLNKKYKRIMDCLKPTSTAAKPLIEAQRAWLKFRDFECKFQGSSVEGGSAQPMIVADCLRDMTDKRNKELDYYLTCAEGDLSCPTVNCGFAPRKP